jgi:uncharacterized protein DUF4159
MIRLHRQPHKHARTSVVAMLLAGLLAPCAVTRGNVTAEQVNDAIRRGVAYLRQTQQPDGGWDAPQAQNRPGLTALCALSLLRAGAPRDDPAIRRALGLLLRTPDSRTYAVGLKCQVLAAADARKHAAALRRSATWLVRTQLENGMWGYGPSGRGDNSNTQFALLGLHAAAGAGVRVPKETWTRAAAPYAKCQVPDGGWDYNSGTRSYGSMTAAGVAGLFICGHRLNVGGAKIFVRGGYPGCGRYQQSQALAGGLEWLKVHFSVLQNPGRGGSWLHYYLYALERVGMIAGIRAFGAHDWYRQGAEMLVATERNGRWGSHDTTAFALLFLTKGNRPVIIQKLRWDGRWSRNLHDLENLTDFIDDKLGKRVTWQSASLDMTLEDLRQSPILFVTGHEFPKFGEDEQKKLKAFVESGGTLLFEACCGKKDFREGFRAFAAKAFPEYPLRPLSADHPVFHSYYDHPKELDSTYELEGIDVGCRTSVFFSPNALSCLWELETIPHFSARAFQLGTNIAAYATGREALGDRLEKVYLPARVRSEAPREVPRGAVRIARLVHEGDYNADPHCLVELASLLRTQAGMDVVAQGRHLRPDDEAIFEYPVVFMHGHYPFRYDDDQIAALRKYLQRGGVLVADSCCGRKTFDASFRAMCARLFPEQSLKALSTDHPIYAGKVGPSLGTLRFRTILAQERKAAALPDWESTGRPPLESITLDGRTVVLYSPYDFSCALEGDKPYSCRGYADADGRRLALRLFLYAIAY